MLEVASASKPKCARSRAVPGSHGLGMMKAVSRSWSARKAWPFSACVGIFCILSHAEIERRGEGGIPSLTFGAGPVTREVKERRTSVVTRGGVVTTRWSGDTRGEGATYECGDTGWRGDNEVVR